MFNEICAIRTKCEKLAKNFALRPSFIKFKVANDKKSCSLPTVQN